MHAYKIKYMTLNSNTENIAAPATKVYTFLSELFQKAQFSNLSNIPDITNVTASETGCSFTIKNMINCNLQKLDQRPFDYVSYKIDTDKGISALISFHISELGIDASSLQTEAEADVPIFLQAMIKAPLQQAINQAMSRLKETIERS